MQPISVKSKLSFARCEKDFLLQVRMRLKNKSKLSSIIDQSLNPSATDDFYILLHKMDNENFMYICRKETSNVQQKKETKIAGEKGNIFTR